LNGTIQGLNDTLKTFAGPRTILSRLSSAKAIPGEILPIKPPFSTASYELRFYGPIVQCEEPNSTVAAIIDDLFKKKMAIPVTPSIYERTNFFFAIVSDFDFLGNSSTIFDGVDVAPLSKIRMQSPANVSNQLWMIYQRYVGDERDVNGKRITEFHRSVCQLYNTFNDIGLKFDQGNQTISRKGIKILNQMDYPKDNKSTDITDVVRHAYSAFMWVLSDQIVGSMGFYEDNSTNVTGAARFNIIDTQLQYNSLLGSSAVLVEELSFNITMNLMSSNLLS
jgi:hypothetical protein